MLYVTKDSIRDSVRTNMDTLWRIQRMVTKMAKGMETEGIGICLQVFERLFAAISFGLDLTDPRGQS